MTPASFRRLALSLKGAIESGHGGHPDFRAGGKVFASMGYPDASSAVVKLTPGQQEILVAAESGIFSPVKGAWGLRGYTRVHLPAADTKTMRSALAMAWKNVMPSAPSRRGATSGGVASPRPTTRPAKPG